MPTVSRARSASSEPTRPCDLRQRALQRVDAGCRDIALIGQGTQLGEFVGDAGDLGDRPRCAAIPSTSYCLRAWVRRSPRIETSRRRPGLAVPELALLIEDDPACFLELDDLGQLGGECDLLAALGLGGEPRLLAQRLQDAELGDAALRHGMGRIELKQDVASLDLGSVPHRDGLDQAALEMLHRLAIALHHDAAMGDDGAVEPRARGPEPAYAHSDRDDEIALPDRGSPVAGGGDRRPGQDELALREVAAHDQAGDASCVWSCGRFMRVTRLMVGPSARWEALRPGSTG